MAVQFILGRSGTGKTDLCIKSIANELLTENADQPLVLLVPEQATYQAEHAILARTNIPGYTRLKVLSFERLQFLLLGPACGQAELSKIARAMIVHRILLARQKELKLFNRAAETLGLADELAQLIVQLHQCRITESDIDQLVQKLKKQNGESIQYRKFADSPPHPAPFRCDPVSKNGVAVGGDER